MSVIQTWLQSQCSLSFEDAGCAHACANAHGNNTELLVCALELAHESADHTAASHTEWVTKGNCTTLRVKLLGRHAQFLYAVGGLGSESLVDLENINLVHGETGSLKSGRDSESRSNAHDLGRNTGDGEANNTAVDAAAESLSNISAGKKDARSTISDLR